MLCKYNAVIMLSWDVKRASMNPVYGNNLCVCVCVFTSFRYTLVPFAVLYVAVGCYTKKEHCLKEFYLILSYFHSISQLEYMQDNN